MKFMHFPVKLFNRTYFNLCEMNTFTNFVQMPRYFMMTMAKSPCSMSVADAKHPLQRLLADTSSSQETSLFMDSFPPTARGIYVYVNI